MTIKVHMFASLSEQLQIEQLDLAATGIETVADVWGRVTGEALPDHVLIAVNQNYAEAQTPVKSGDEVAFFPPVTGG